MYWQYQMKVALHSQGLWRIIEGKDIEPDEYDDPNAHEDWASRNCDVIQQIVMNLKGELMNMVVLCSTAKECWDSLINHYQEKGNMQAAQLMSNPYHSNLTELEPIEPQINRILLVVQTLTILGCPITDKVLGFQLILMLLDSLEFLKVLLYQIPLADITVDWVKTIILSNEKWWICTSGKPVASFYTKATKEGSKKGKDKDKSGKREWKHCTHCN
jgi:hypothetical protein